MKNKTKTGAVIVGVGLALATIGGLIQGNISTYEALTAFVGEIGGVLLAFGIRDWPVINKPK